MGFLHEKHAQLLTSWSMEGAIAFDSAAALATAFTSAMFQSKRYFFASLRKL
jgi:hypothetical protein